MCIYIYILFFALRFSLTISWAYIHFNKEIFLTFCYSCVYTIPLCGYTVC